MSAINDQHIKALNSLVEATLDSADGYRDAAKDATNPRFKSLFEKRSMERNRLTADLQTEIRGLGGTPADDVTILASAHRLFLNLKNAVTGSDQGIVDEVEAGEDHIKTKFEHALQKEHLSAPVQDVVSKVYAAIKADHDQMRDLKRELRAHPSPRADAS
jgi:uncharacterized protein (TIGR02284 family)